MVNQALQQMFQSRSVSVSDNVQSTDLLDWTSLFTSQKPNVVNYKQSLKISAVYNAVDQISNDIAKIPFAVYQKTETSRNRVSNHPADMLLHNGPNEYITAFMDRKVGAISLLLRGNALWQIITNNNGLPIALEFINWDEVKDIKKVNGTLRYEFIKRNPLLASEVIHLKWFSFDGIVGVSVITYAALQMGLALDITKFSVQSFENRGLSKGVVETDKTLNAAGAKEKIINGFQNAMANKNPERVVVLDDGLKYKSIQMTPQEAAIVEMNQVSIEDIARWFNIAPHKIKSLKQSTNNNIEQQSLDHGSDTIQPILTNWEQEYSKKLLTTTEKLNNFYIKGNLKAIFRSDIKSQSEYYSKAANTGWMTRNEIRALEDLPPLPGLEEPLTPVNTQTTSQINKKLQDEKNNN